MDTQRKIAVLTRIRKALSDEKRWTQGSSARDAKGEPCSVSKRPPVAWCLVGAFWQFGKDKTQESASLDFFERNLLPNGDWSSVTGFNDDPETKHGDILDFLDWNIGMAQAELEG